ncbi:MAG: hypothetical protein FJZ05_00675 [Candidatus Nealsonbacteria bacterium]|nr:hypothetical protein [Candidatus Nealsonbacteria bacterium]
MEKILENSFFFYILTLICLTGFLVLPNICFGYDLENITLGEIKTYLELPEKDVQNLLFTLNQIFTTDWIYRESSTSAIDQEILVPLILRKIIRIQILNHLLVDAPIQASWTIIKNAINITKLFLTQDPSVILNELEKESVEKAVAYGINFLLGNEIRMTPGAIEYEYISQRGNEEKIIIQYILIYQPIDSNQGNLVIRFFSPQPIDPPKSEGPWGMIGTPHSIEGKLPSFIVDIRGIVENYKWVNNPSIQIDFQSEVPDLGIKPLSFWEKYLLKPITNKIKEVEILITKSVGGTPVLGDFWNNIKSLISEIINFSPASVSQTLSSIEEQYSNNKTSGQLTVTETDKGLVDISFQQSKKEGTNKDAEENNSSKTGTPTLEEMQEMLDDIAEQIDILTQKFAELMKEKQQELEDEIDEDEEEEDKEEKEKLKEDDFCWVNINTASKEELQKLTGIGPVLAQRIIEARPFYSINDLLKVSGIGDKTLQGIIGQNCAYVDGSYAGSGGSNTALKEVNAPQILLFYPQTVPVNKEIGATLSASDFKNDTYDVKISIEKDEVLSEIYNENESKWQSSQYYLKNLFSGKAFSGNLKLRIKETKKDFRGEADILARIRESGKSSYSEFKGKININDPEQATSTSEEEVEEPQEPGTLEVIINEISWMGTNSSSNDEWIELYNNTDSDIDLTDWQILKDGEEFIIISTSTANSLATTTILAHQYYLLESTDNNTISDIKADFIFKGNLRFNNDGNKLELKDRNSNLIDKVGCFRNKNGDCKAWFAGTTTPAYISMERIDSSVSGADSGNWGNNNLITHNGRDAGNNFINGTPRAENSLSVSETYIGKETLRFGEFDQITLTKLGNPYLIGTKSSGIFILIIPEEKTLIIEPGVILKFKGNSSGGSAGSYENSNLIIEGTLIAQGEENNPIVFTSHMDVSGSLGWWGQIYFNPSSQNSIFDYCQIRYGGKKESDSSIVIVDSTSIEFKNSILENFNVSGLKLIDSHSQIENITIQNAPSGAVMKISGGNPIIKNSTFKNTYSGIIIGGGSGAEIIGNYFEEIKHTQGAVFVGDSCPILKDNTGQNNVLNGIYFYGSVDKDCTLYQNNDFPYIAEFEVTNTGNLIIEPGVILKFKKYGKLDIEGKLFVQGYSDKKIIFTSIADDDYGGDTNNDGSSTEARSFFWDKIFFNASGEGSFIKNAEIRYGGIPDPDLRYRGVIYVVQTGVELEDIYFKNNGPSGYTLYLENSSSTVRNCVFDNSEISKGTAITITGQDQNVLENNSFQNFYCYIKKSGECIFPLP